MGRNRNSKNKCFESRPQNESITEVGEARMADRVQGDGERCVLLERPTWAHSPSHCRVQPLPRPEPPSDLSLITSWLCLVCLAGCVVLLQAFLQDEICF